MKNVLHRAPARKSRGQLDLFGWQPVTIFRPTAYATRKLAARHGITLLHAATVARLAGIGGMEVTDER